MDSKVEKGRGQQSLADLDNSGGFVRTSPASGPRTKINGCALSHVLNFSLLICLRKLISCSRGCARLSTSQNISL
jgi:hypothetical protein